MRAACSRLVAALVWARVASATGSTCAFTGGPAPDVITMVAPAESPPTDAMLYPDCAWVPVSVSQAGVVRIYAYTGVQRVASISSFIQDLSISSELSRGGDFTGGHPNLAKISLQDLGATAANSFTFPASLKTLEFVGTSMRSFDGLTLPTAMTSLTLKQNPVPSMKNVMLPSSINFLDLSSNRLVALDFALPSSLQKLDLTNNPITALERVVFPDSLTDLICNQCPITSVRGVKWPRRLANLALGVGQISTFEIRKSDLPVVLKATLTASINQPRCADQSADMVPHSSGNICVISDERFNELYFGGPPASSGGSAPSPETSSTDGASGELPPSSSLGANGASGHNSGGSLGGTSSDPTGNSTSGEAQGVYQAGDDDTLAGNDENSPSSGGDDNSSSNTKKRGSTGKRDSGSMSSATEAVNKESSAPSNTVIIVLAVLGVGVLLLAGVFVRRWLLAKEKTKSEELTTTSGSYTSAVSPKSWNSSAIQARAYPNDVRSDKALEPYRIDYDEIKFERVLARSSFCVVYEGAFAGQRVAIKQLLPDTWRDDTRVVSFMNEIRLCVSLDHPKIVQCIGLGWTGLRDLAVVVEFMRSGDLRAVLQSQSDIEQSGREWSEPWTALHRKCKTSIAADIADALVYLQSFETPIIHRDLKAKNVLLDALGNAKLGDFGTSREMPVDETMTRNIGAVAWIAPEVLRGERYNEKADIYSLGVLMVELDKCHHPYAHERGSMPTNDGSANETVLKNAQIAILVSSGKLRPTPSQLCPEGIRQLVARCVSFSAAERPNAMQVHHELRLFLQSTAE